MSGVQECGLRFDHLGVVVPEMGAGRTFLEQALGISQWTAVVEDAGIGVDVQFGTSGDGMVYELIAPRGENSPVSNALRNGKHILNHVAYRTDDLVAAGERLRAQGCVATGEPQPAVAYGERRVQFFVSPLRFVVELIEALEHEHAYVARASDGELVR